MEFTIRPEIFETYPACKIGLLICKEIDNTLPGEKLLEQLRETQRAVKEKLRDAVLVEQPKIADWRVAYSAFGAKPKKHRSSVEALLRRVMKGEQLPNINNLVNAYNLVSIKHQLPVGGDNLDSVAGSIVLDFATGDETFVVLGSQEVTHPNEKEVVYRDEKEILCRRWNWRECEKTKMTLQTTTACLVVEGLESTTQEELELALQELQQLVQEHLGAATEMKFLDRKKQRCLLD